MSPDACSYATEVGLRVMRTKGAALFIDYGHASQPIETMQAALKHAYAPPPPPLLRFESFYLQT